MLSCAYTRVKLIFVSEMSCEKFLHVRFCGDAVENCDALLVSHRESFGIVS